MSHPSWVCGLKLMYGANTIEQKTVTPFVGVWIETLKATLPLAAAAVTPFVGVWIETAFVQISFKVSVVTPFVGVWIETSTAKRLKIDNTGHTLRGCVD